MLTSELIATTERHLLSGHREVFNRLDGAHTSSVTTITLKDEAKIKRGDVLSVNLELMLAVADSTAAKTVEVQRAYLGSTAAAHSDNDLVFENAKFPKFSILEELNNEFDSLSAEGLFRIKTTDLTYVASQSGYDVTGVTDFLDIHEMRWDAAGSSKNWPLIRNYAVSRDMDTSEFASGVAVFIYEGVHPSATIRVRYKARFGQLTGLTDDVEVVTGIHREALDIPPMGAGARLMIPRDVKRAFTESQGEPRRADEVPPSSQVRAAQGLMVMREQRVNREISRLQAQYPTQLRT